MVGLIDVFLILDKRDAFGIYLYLVSQRRHFENIVFTRKKKNLKILC